MCCRQGNQSHQGAVAARHDAEEQTRWISRLRCLKRPPWARNDLDGAPHPHRDQVHICLAHFRPRARNPRIRQGESGFSAAGTISPGFGSVMGLARESGSGWIIYLLEPRRYRRPRRHLACLGGYICLVKWPVLRQHTPTKTRKIGQNGIKAEVPVPFVFNDLSNLGR
jgi:hypothetical protein